MHTQLNKSLMRSPVLMFFNFGNFITKALGLAPITQCPQDIEIELSEVLYYIIITIMPHLSVKLDRKWLYEKRNKFAYEQHYY